MSVGVDGETFIVPLTAIIESLQPRKEDIKSVAGDTQVVHIRGEYLPIIPLSDVFGGTPCHDLEKGIFVVVEAEAGKAALFVDELLGQHQVVIKSLEANYRKVPGTSGATITLESAGGISQAAAAAAPIVGDKARIVAAGGSARLDNSANQITTLAAQAIDGDLSFVNSQALTLGQVNTGSVSGASAGATAAMGRGRSTMASSRRR